MSQRTIIRQVRRQIGEILRRIPLTRRLLTASSDYRILSREEALASSQRSGGWLNGLTAKRQQQAYDALLTQMRSGDPRVDLSVAVEAVRATGIARPSILEIGCGGGYYSGVFEHLLGRPFNYVGVDYSPAMVETARRAFPGHRFEIGDATALAFPDAAFDIGFNGVSLMHILDYAQAIAETRRVSRSYCIFHSVPVFRDRATTYLSKYAYGAPVIEIVFDRAALLDLFERNSLSLVESWPSLAYDVHPVTAEHSTCETYLLRVVH